MAKCSTVFIVLSVLTVLSKFFAEEYSVVLLCLSLLALLAALVETAFRARAGKPSAGGVDRLQALAGDISARGGELLRAELLGVNSDGRGIGLYGAAAAGNMTLESFTVTYRGVDGRERNTVCDVDFYGGVVYADLGAGLNAARAETAASPAVDAAELEREALAAAPED